MAMLLSVGQCFRFRGQMPAGVLSGTKHHRPRLYLLGPAPVVRTPW